MDYRGSTTASGGWRNSNGRSRLKLAASGLAMLMAAFTDSIQGLAVDQIHQEGTPHLQIAVRVFTFIPLAPVDLTAAERETSMIFQKAGVDVKWVNCSQPTQEARQDPSCQTPNAPTEIFVRVVPDFLEDHYVPKSSMGYAVPTQTPHHGYVAGIALERARKQLLDGRTLTLGQLLGFGMAHEIGHLLLGTNSHSPSGLMCAHWGKREMVLAARGQFGFSAQQAEIIRADVQARISEQASRQQAAQAMASKSASH